MFEGFKLFHACPPCLLRAQTPLWLAARAPFNAHLYIPFIFHDAKEFD